MDSLEYNLQVTWRHRVRFVSGVFRPANRALRDVLAGEPGGRRPRALVVLDAMLAKAQPGLAGEIPEWFAAHAEAVELTCPPLILEGGEAIKKSLAGVHCVLEAIHRAHIDRHSFVIAVGGGALLDAVGLAAALAHRGCRHVRIPTTTLSQCDSGVGVKNGVNAFGQKNFLGTFSPPYAVLNDFDFLATLPPAVRRGGFAEAVKVACIREARFFDELERDAEALRDFAPEPMRRLIRRCAELHLRHIVSGGDPFEMGSARPLDFGHWAAHKLEALSGFSLSHSDAVAIGIAVDVLYCRHAGLLEEASAARILALLERLGFALYTPLLAEREPGGRFRVLAGLDDFREHLGGRLCVTLLRGIGDAFEVNELDPARVAAAIEQLAAR